MFGSSVCLLQGVERGQLHTQQVPWVQRILKQIKHRPSHKLHLVNGIGIDSP